METVIKNFYDLTLDELVKIYQLRVAVFVVEQNCAYQEIDDLDKYCVHICFWEDGKLQAYCRVIPQGVLSDNVHIGRVISIKRRCGLGTQLLNAGIEYAKDVFKAEKIIVEAQVYARKLYEKCGFVQVSEEFLEDAIPNINMELCVK